MSNGVDFKKISLENRELLNSALAREAALQKELDSIKASVDGFESPEHAAQVADTLGHANTALQQRLTVAEQRAGELEKDGARLDFIQKNWVSIRCNVKNTGFCGPRGKEFEAYIYAAGANDKKPGEGETIRQAIDNMSETNGAALKQAAEPELDKFRTIVELFPDSPGCYYNGCPLSALSDPMQCWRDGYEMAKKRAIAAGLKVKP